MNIQHFEIRETDNLELLKPYMCDDVISVVNDFLGNDLISSRSVIKYKNQTFEYQRKIRWVNCFKPYHQLNVREKECIENILKILFENQERVYFRNQIQKKLNRKNYKFVCDCVNRMIENGICRYRLKKVKFDTYNTDENGNQIFNYKSIPCVYIPKLEDDEDSNSVGESDDSSSEYDSEDEPIM